MEEKTKKEEIKEETKERVREAIRSGIERRSKDGKEIKELVRDPVCGMELPGNRLFMREFVGGVVYGFCSESCLEAFDLNPGKYLIGSPASGREEKFAGGSHEHMTRDPICGMTVDERTALSIESAGKRFYFCSPNCQSAFESL